MKVTLERMLDSRYDEHLYQLTPAEAVDKLLKMVEKTCTPMVAASLGQLDLERDVMDHKGK